MSLASPQPQNDNQPTVDQHIGARLRALREARSISQQAIADALSLTLEQAQDLETGAKRISASKLFTAARLLEVHISEVFEGLDLLGSRFGDELDPASPDQLALDVEFARAVQALRGMTDPIKRQAVVNIIWAVVGTRRLGASPPSPGNVST